MTQYNDTSLGALLRAKLERNDERAREDAGFVPHEGCQCEGCEPDAWTEAGHCGSSLERERRAREESERDAIEREESLAAHGAPKWRVRADQTGRRIIKVERSDRTFTKPIHVSLTTMGLIADVAGTMGIPREQVVAAMLNNAHAALRNMLDTHVAQGEAERALREARERVEQAYAVHGDALSRLFGETNQYAADEAQ